MTETEELPEDWNIKKYGEVTDIIGGSTPSTDTDKYWGGEINWAVPSEVTDRAEVEFQDTERKITQEGLDSGSINILPEKSVLMTSRATVGVPVINNVPMATNQGFQNFDLSGSDDLIAYYLYYQILENADYIDSIANGGTFDEISKSELTKLRIGVPEVSEQRRIASVLYSVDEQIRTLTDRHDSLTQLKHGLMQDLLTGETRVTPEIDIREEEFKETSDELSDIETTEESWETMNFDEVAEITTGKSYPSDAYCENGVPLFRISNIGNYNQDDIEMLPDKYYKQTDGSRILNDGNIVMALSGATTGKCSLVKPEIAPCILNQRVGKFVPKTPVRRLFMYYLINSSEFQENVGIMATGAAQDNIGIKDLKSIPVRIPPLWEQERIASVLYTVDEMIARTSDLMDEYERLKRGLMQDLLSGDVRTTENLEVLDEITDN